MKNVKNIEPRHLGTFNFIIFYSLYIKETRRFVAIIGQTVIAPVITILLFLAVFSLSLGRNIVQVGDLSFIAFIVPGLIVMNMINNAFAGSSSSIVAGKMMGSIIDLIMPPMSTVEIILAFVCAGITRGVLVGLVGGIIVSLFTPVGIHSLLLLLLYSILGCGVLSLLGIVTGIWADKWENVSAITTFLITPLSFLSGTFYSIHQLPDAVQGFANLNPFFFIIDGFRFSLTGYSDSDPYRNIFLLFLIFIGLFILAKKLLDIGYKLKS